jgi:peptide/nickel transport system permease protein
LSRLLRRIRDSDAAYDLVRSPVTMLSGLVFLLLVGGAILGPLISPHDPFDLSQVSLMDSLRPPAWMADGDPAYLLGTDNQGRDMLSAVIAGLRISLGVGVCGVALAASVGVTLGLISGYFQGLIGAVIMRVAEVQQTFPAILVALLTDGILQGVFKGADRERTGYWVLILSIAMAFWVQYARTVRASTMVESSKDYIAASRLIGRRPAAIMVEHLLINVSGPVLVIATINLALAIITEATLSFLGVGVPPTQPSLGTLIRVGNDFLFSGEWWVAFFPGLTLAILSISVNLLGDWLRDVLNPRLR